MSSAARRRDGDDEEEPKRGNIAPTTCLCFIFMLPLGIYLAYQGGIKLEAQCPASPSLSKAALVLGLAYISASLAALRVVFFACLTAAGGDPKRTGGVSWGCSMWIIFGVLIWASVACFQDNLWTRMQDDALAPTLCDRDLYRGTAIAVIAAWCICLFFIFMVLACLSFALIAFSLASCLRRGGGPREGGEDRFNFRRVSRQMGLPIGGRANSQRSSASAATDTGSGNGATAPRQPEETTPAPSATAAAPLLAVASG